MRCQLVLLKSEGRSSKEVSGLVKLHPISVNKWLDGFSLAITKPTVVVLDNARVYTAAKVKKALAGWQKRGLFLFYLPPYSPQLNIAERLWKELKARWLRPEDYHTTDHLFYAVKLALAAVGKQMFINFSD